MEIQTAKHGPRFEFSLKNNPLNKNYFSTFKVDYKLYKSIENDKSL
jgi:hypothetical protein